jgi:hypothetical protein
MIDCLALSTLTRYPAMFIWDQGIVSVSYFNENDNLAAINLKKGIMSLFQYKQDNASEIDTLGKCKTEYRIYEDRLVKDKSECSNIRYNDEYSNAKQVRRSNVTYPEIWRCEKISHRRCITSCPRNARVRVSHRYVLN